MNKLEQYNEAFPDPDGATILEWHHALRTFRKQMHNHYQKQFEAMLAAAPIPPAASSDLYHLPKQLPYAVREAIFAINPTRQGSFDKLVETIYEAIRTNVLPGAIAPAPATESLTDSYIQTVPDECDRIVWRNSYYHLPIPPAPEVAPVAWLNDMGTEQKLSFVPLEGAHEHEALVRATHPANDGLRKAAEEACNFLEGYCAAIEALSREPLPLHKEGIRSITNALRAELEKKS